MADTDDGRNGATILDFTRWRRRVRPQWAAEQDLRDRLADAAMDSLHARAPRR